MRLALGGLLFLAVSVGASAQSEVKPEAAAKSQANVVTLEELQGTKLQVSWTFAARIRNSQGEFPSGRTIQQEVKLGPGAGIQVTQTETGWFDHPKGRKTSQITRGFAGTIGVPGKSKDGSATNLWLFEKGTLTRLSVVEVGGQTLKISFERSATGLRCSAQVALAQEIGAGNRVDRATGGGKMEVLSARLTGNPTCRVVQKS